jgi:hypothetical protein
MLLGPESEGNDPGLYVELLSAGGSRHIGIENSEGNRFADKERLQSFQ